MRAWPLLWTQEGTVDGMHKGWSDSLAGQATARAAVGVHSLAALPGRTPALHGVDDFVVHNRPIGAVQGHMHGLRPRGRAAGALFLHVLYVNRVHGFAGTLAL